MNDPHQPWERLTRAARQVSDPRDTSAPYGFATRVVAQAMAARSMARSGALFEQFALRGLFAAGALSLAAAAFGFSAITEERTYTELYGDTVVEVLAES